MRLSDPHPTDPAHLESALLASMAARVRRPQADRNKVRHRTEASAALERLFAGSDIPGVANAAQVARSAFQVGYRPAERLTVSEWADEHRMLTGVGASAPGPWRTSRTPYLKEVMDQLSEGSPTWKVAFIAGAQVGKTESGLNWIGYIMAAAPGPTMFVVPKVDTAKKISKQRLGPLINSTAPVREAIYERLLLSVEFAGGVLFFASAQSASDLMSMPARYIYCDECDRFPFDVQGEGPPVNLAVARTNTFNTKRKIFLTSTPTHESTSIIWAAWLEGDMRLYHMPCPNPSCGEWITFEFENLKWEWGNAEKTVHYVCPCCQHRIPEAAKKTMLPAGEWRPTRKDLDKVEEGVRSYRLPGLYAPLGWNSWASIAKKWEACQGIPSKIAEFRNVELGLPSIEVTDRVDWEALMGRAYVGEDPYDIRTVPKGVLYLTAGIDVGVDHVEMGVWGWGRDRKRWLVDHIRMDGNPRLPEIWQQVSDAIYRTYEDSRGVEFGILRAFVDTGHWPDIVKPWVRTQNQQIVMGCDGQHERILNDTFKIVTQADPIPGMPGKKTNAGALKIAWVGSGFLKTELMGLFAIPHPEKSTEAPPGWLHLPKQGFTKEMAKQLSAERKVIERNQNGRVTGSRWERVEGRRAEVLDCYVYARGAAALVGFDRFAERDFQRLEARIEEAAAEIASAKAAEARGAPVAVPPKSTVGVTRKPAQIVVRPRPEPEKASREPRPGVSTAGVHTVGAPRRIVPTPRALRIGDD